jgi:hypothetical protein
LEALRVYRSIILKYILKKQDETGLDWNDLAHNGDESRAVVNKVMNLRVP